MTGAEAPRRGVLFKGRLSAPSAVVVLSGSNTRIGREELVLAPGRKPTECLGMNPSAVKAVECLLRHASHVVQFAGHEATATGPGTSAEVNGKLQARAMAPAASQRN